MTRNSERIVRNPGWRRALLPALLLAAIAALPAAAQTNEENYGQLEFNFITPGARASAMGGAFIGLADDATAAESNPAGLVILSRPEVSFEYKFIDNSREMYIGENSWVTGNRTTVSDSTSMPAFFSYVHPFERFTLSVYRNQTVNFSQSFITDGPLVGVNDYRLYPVDSELEMTLTNLGVGAAFRVNEHFSAGASLRYSTFDLETTLTRWDFDRSYVNNESTVDDDDSSITFNLGLLYTFSPRFSLGGVYRHGGSYDVAWMRVIDPSGANVMEQETLTFNIPEVYGLGLSWRPLEPLVVAFDVVRVNYSELIDNLVLIYNADSQMPSQYSIDDVTEFHLGGEYTWLVKNMPLSARLGLYNDPDSSMNFSGGGSVESEATRIRFPGGDDQLHVTGGMGIVIRDRLQFDAAYDYADLNEQFSISAIYRF